MKPFPWNFRNGYVVGENSDGEPLGLVLYDDTLWLVRLSNEWKEWSTSHPATVEERQQYDMAFLKEMGVSNDSDTRTEYQPVYNRYW